MKWTNGFAYTLNRKRLQDVWPNYFLAFVGAMTINNIQQP